ncbi:MAG TPA: carbohydrate ABC transporter permease, partial [Clostridia bacterium]|nr:carbohydrate ABC transporter permease [Clostridia bacterium]
MRIRESLGDRVFNAVNLILMGIVLLLVLYPLYYIVIASISDPVLVNTGQVTLYPRGILLEGYRRVLQHDALWLGYRNSILYMTLGTAISLGLTIPAAYGLANRDLVGRNALMMVFTLTMMFNGGLIPTYLVVKSLRIPNTVWALVLPGALSVFNLIVSRTYMQRSIPRDLVEAAMIDGAATLRVFFRIVLPLSVPLIAVIALYYGIARWNDYFTALIYVSKRPLVPLQVVLREILIQTDMAATADAGESMAEQAKLAEIMKYCVIIAASLPAMVAYPFVQKYFV